MLPCIFDPVPFSTLLVIADVFRACSVCVALLVVDVCLGLDSPLPTRYDEARASDCGWPNLEAMIMRTGSSREGQ